MACWLFTPYNVVCPHGPNTAILWLGSHVKFQRSCYHFRSHPVGVLAKWNFRLAIRHDSSTSDHSGVSSHSIAVKQGQLALHFGPAACSNTQYSVYCILINPTTASHADCNCLQLLNVKTQTFSCRNMRAAAVELRVLLTKSFTSAFSWLAVRFCKGKVARLSNIENIFISPFSAPCHDFVNVRRAGFCNVQGCRRGCQSWLTCFELVRVDTGSFRRDGGNISSIPAQSRAEKLSPDWHHPHEWKLRGNFSDCVWSGAISRVGILYLALVVRNFRECAPDYCWNFNSCG